MLRTSTVLAFCLIVAACGAEDVERAPSTSAAPAATSTVTTTASVPAATSTTVADDSPPATEPRPPTTTTTEAGIRAFEFVVTSGEVADLRATLDDDVRITIHSDQADEVHVHGYDIHADVGPDSPAVIEFVAAIPGIFEIEFEGDGTLIAELRVDP